MNALQQKQLARFSEEMQKYITEINSSKMTNKEKIASLLEVIKEKEEKYLKTYPDKYTSTKSDTYEHSYAVAKTMKEAARELGHDKKTQHIWYLTGLGHDLGKITVDNNVLLKTGKLTWGDINIEIAKHSICGTEIIKNLKLSKDITRYLQIAAGAHHIDDGGGQNTYKFAVENSNAKTDIEMAVNMVNMLEVIDKYHAFRQERCYKEGVSHKDTMNYLEGQCKMGKINNEAFTIFKENLVDKLQLDKRMNYKKNKKYAPSSGTLASMKTTKAQPNATNINEAKKKLVRSFM